MLSSIPRLPANSWIRIEPLAAAELQLTWQPFPERRVHWERWTSALWLACWLVGWSVGALVAGAVLTSLLIDLLGKGASVGWGVALFMTVWLCFWMFGGINTMGQLRNLLRRARPERLLLTPQALHHDPGHWPAGPPAEGSAREVPWDQVGEVRLERDGMGVQRLTLGPDGDRIEIGASLREPEREWLAEVLRAWAKQQT